MLIKLDMSKAYDHVRWRFLMNFFGRYGFSNKWNQWIFGCISSTEYLFLINGVPCGFFDDSCELHQGDSLSLFLIVLMIESLIRRIDFEVHVGN
jgi:hypothetical protein